MPPVTSPGSQAAPRTTVAERAARIRFRRALSLMAMTLPAKTSVGALLPILIAGDVTAIVLHHRHAQWRPILRLLPWVVAGMIPAWFALGRLDDRQVKPLLGLLVLGMLALELAQGLESLGPVDVEGEDAVAQDEAHVLPREAADLLLRRRR